MDAHMILTAAQTAGPTVRGVIIRDPANPDTWTFFPHDALPEDVRNAVAAIQVLVDAPPPVDPVKGLRAELRADLDELRNDVDAIAAATKTPLPPRRPRAGPPP